MLELWRNLARRITAVNADPICGMYRFEIPLRGMVERSWCSANIHALGQEDLAYVPGNPLLVQRLVSLDAPMVDGLHARKCRFIHDIDDLLWDIPTDNPNHEFVSPDMLDAMDTSLRLADLVTTSTEPLAAALERRGIPAVIIPNILDPADWCVLPVRAERSRLRVGWYGQANVHVADLDVIETVVGALARDVDFVFFGDLPRTLAARRAEFEVHSSTTIELFPTMLARLDLDILLSPLAKNAFNECKSNLRLIQAGMLGYAVIATDIEPHRTLPVTLVENTSSAWVAAIRDRVGEIEAVRKEARVLHAAVHERYTLNDASAERIFTTWTGRAPPTIAA